jgi:hypothetical protein
LEPAAETFLRGAMYVVLLLLKGAAELSTELNIGSVNPSLSIDKRFNAIMVATVAKMVDDHFMIEEAFGGVSNLTTVCVESFSHHNICTTLCTVLFVSFSVLVSTEY